jgi:CMP-N-acetylneuraminic acid synthetase
MTPALGIVPARLGSKRLPGKNMKLVGGKPLVAWAIEAALGAKRLGEVVVSSDDPRVLEIARRYPRARALERPAELATDTTPAIDYVRHALGALGGAWDAVAIVQPSSPLTLASDVDGTLDVLWRSGAPSAASVVRLDQALQPSKLKRLVGDRLVPYLEEEGGRTAAHELPELYVRNGSVYAARRSALDAGRVIADDCRAYVMPRERSVDVNDARDLAFAEFLLARR